MLGEKYRSMVIIQSTLLLYWNERFWERAYSLPHLWSFVLLFQVFLFFHNSEVRSVERISSQFSAPSSPHFSKFHSPNIFLTSPSIHSYIFLLKILTSSTKDITNIKEFENGAKRRREEKKGELILPCVTQA